MSKHGWSKHYKRFWRDHAINEVLPDWLRVVSLAYGRHAPNGHSMFASGEIARSLGRADPSSQLVVPNENVHRAIKTAVERGFLDPNSHSRCLVVPIHGVTGGLGNQWATCPFH